MKEKTKKLKNITTPLDSKHMSTQENIYVFVITARRDFAKIMSNKLLQLYFVETSNLWVLFSRKKKKPKIQILKYDKKQTNKMFRSKSAKTSTISTNTTRLLLPSLKRPSGIFTLSAMLDMGLMGTSASPGIAVNALPRSCALALSSTEWQQALTASPAQRNLHRMAPTLGNIGPLKMNGSIYKNWLTSRVSAQPREQRIQRKEKWKEAKKKDKMRDEQSIDGVEGQCWDKRGEKIRWNRTLEFLIEGFHQC